MGIFKGGKEKAAGVLLLVAIVPLAVLGYLIIAFVGFFNADRVRAGVRAMDHFVNASVFNGNAWESVSSHAWRERERPWARAVIRITNYFQQGHCERANRREQKVVDFVIRKGLHKQTIV